MGTSPLAPALAHAACRQGVEGLCVNPHKRLQPLPGGRADGTGAQRLQRALHPALPVLDDVGLKPLVDPAPADLDEVMHARAALGSRLVTRHRAPTEGPALCGHPLLASAGVARWAPHAEPGGITGRSYRAQGRPLSESLAAEPATARRGGPALPLRHPCFERCPSPGSSPAG
jgi:IstB-like ATP binding protein